MLEQGLILIRQKLRKINVTEFSAKSSLSLLQGRSSFRTNKYQTEVDQGLPCKAGRLELYFVPVLHSTLPGTQGS